MNATTGYTTYDLSESLDRVGIERATVERVLAAWGGSSEGYADWAGGFLLKLRDARYAYVFGWCDTSGWGCQDDASVAYFDVEPKPGNLPDNPEWGEGRPEVSEWDIDPADLNIWVAQGEPDPVVT